MARNQERGSERGHYPPPLLHARGRTPRYTRGYRGELGTADEVTAGGREARIGLLSPQSWRGIKSAEASVGTTHPPSYTRADAPPGIPGGTAGSSGRRMR